MYSIPVSILASCLFAFVWRKIASTRGGHRLSFNMRCAFVATFCAYFFGASIMIMQAFLPRTLLIQSYAVVALPVAKSNPSIFVVDRSVILASGFQINVKSADGDESIQSISPDETVEVHEMPDLTTAGTWKRITSVHDCSSWVAHWTIPCHPDGVVVKNELYVPTNTVEKRLFFVQRQAVNRD